MTTRGLKIFLQPLNFEVYWQNTADSLFSLDQNTLPMIISKTSTIFKFWLCLLTSCVILGKYALVS